jgi:hypothetical protein
MIKKNSIPETFYLVHSWCSCRITSNSSLKPSTVSSTPLCALSSDTMLPAANNHGSTGAIPAVAIPRTAMPAAHEPLRINRQVPKASQSLSRRVLAWCNARGHESRRRMIRARKMAKYWLFQRKGWSSPQRSFSLLTVALSVTLVLENRWRLGSIPRSSISALERSVSPRYCIASTGWQVCPGLSDNRGSGSRGKSKSCPRRRASVFVVLLSTTLTPHVDPRWTLSTNFME